MEYHQLLRYMSLRLAKITIQSARSVSLGLSRSLHKHSRIYPLRKPQGVSQLYLYRACATKSSPEKNFLQDDSTPKDQDDTEDLTNKAPGNNIQEIKLGNIENEKSTETSEVNSSSSLLDLKESTKLGKGLKMAPIKQRLVILDARDSKVASREVPEYFRRPTSKQSNPIGASMDFAFLDFEKKRNNLLVFKSTLSESQITESIDLMNPKGKKNVSVKRFNQLKKDLNTAYKTKQIRDYILSSRKEYHLKSTYTQSIIKASTKKQLIDIILSDMWRLKPSNTIDDISDVLVERTISLAPKDLFLLCCNSGRMISDLTIKTGAQIAIATGGQEIIIRGTTSAINLVEAQINRTINNTISEEIDLSGIATLYGDTPIPIQQIEQVSNVYFDPVDVNNNPFTQRFVMTALDANGLDDVRRYLISSLDYKNGDSRIQQMILHPQNMISDNVRVFNIAEEEALSWNDRVSTWGRLQEAKPKLIAQTSSNSSLADILVKTGREVSKFDKLFQKADSERREKEEKSNDYDADIRNAYDTLQKSLTDFKQKKKMGVAEQFWEPPTLTATFGFIIYNTEFIAEDMHTEVEKLFNRKQGSLSTRFLTNIPLIHDKVLELPLYDPISSNDQLMWEDKHDYFVQMSFLPSPFKNVDNFKDRPPIEMWIDLDEKNRAISGSERMVTTELESSVLFSLPNKSSDIKLSVAYVGNVVEPLDVDELQDDSSSSERKMDLFEEDDTPDSDKLENVWENNENEEIDQHNVFKQTVETEKNLKSKEIENKESLSPLSIENQPGLKHFLQNANLDFSGNSSINIPNNLNMKFADGEVDYKFQNAFYRRQLFFKFRGMRLQFSIIEGGVLSGRRMEVTLVASENIDEMDYNTFSKAVKDAIAFVDSLRTPK